MAQRFKTPITIEDATSAASQAVAAKVNGDTQNRVNIDAGGKITWGDGSSAGDTNLYRSAADALKTDDTLEAAAGIITSTSSGAPTATISDGAIAVDTTNDKLYFRSGSTWQVVTGGGATNSDTAPSSPSDGDLWFESDTGGFYVYYDSQWIDIGGTSVANVAASSSAPSSPAVGDMWLDTDTLQTFVYYDDGNTSQWVEIGVTGTVNAIEDADGNTKIQVEESANENKIRFDTDGTERMIIDDSGNVGIGTASPSQKLHVNSGVGNVAGLFESTDSVALVQIKDNASSANPPAVAAVGDDMRLQTNGSSRVTVDSSGNVGIGTTSPSYKLDVNGDINATGDLRIGGTAIGGWQSYTPTLTNWTASSTSFEYAVVNEIVFVRIYAVVATMGSSPRFSLPSGYANNGSPQFQRVGLLDSGSTWYDGMVLGHSTTEVNLMCVYTAGTFAGYSAITATAPFTWAAGDAVDGLFFYKS